MNVDISNKERDTKAYIINAFTKEEEPITEIQYLDYVILFFYNHTYYYFDKVSNAFFKLAWDAVGYKPSCWSIYSIEADQPKACWIFTNEIETLNIKVVE